MCACLARGSKRQEEQVAPRQVLPGWWVTIGGRCPFTIHVPSGSADSGCVPVTQRDQREDAHTAMLENLQFISSNIHDFIVAVVPELMATIIFGGPNFDLNRARFNSHKPACVSQHKVEGLAPSPWRPDVTLCQFNLAYQFMESLIATLLYFTVK